ncbi:MAG TPA: hypothetical protein VMH20_08590 [Verrucomicrobiae bacterium]|nr:hypothetical protein [Verrucomicrobiae bacterium]
MPAKKTKKQQKLSLKPVKKHLEGILAELKKQLHIKGITQAQKAIVNQDIKNLKVVIAELPTGCHKAPPYDIGL